MGGVEEVLQEIEIERKISRRQLRPFDLRERLEAMAHLDLANALGGGAHMLARAPEGTESRHPLVIVL
jgi:hypothetical protein